ncbi:MAG: helix-turn-helix domain-containing protein [archaeon]|nr:helix-turn-helix domain-containing protein [archaeon]
MQCEICGKNKAEFETQIDGAKMLVCTQCKQFGENSHTISQKPLHFQTKEKLIPQSFDEGLEISQEFGQKIRTARQKFNLTLKELAQKMYEKESTLQRIENNSLLPSEAQIKKLEKELKIKLKQKLE